MKESMNDAGYKFVKNLGVGRAVFIETAENSLPEIWQKNNGHASWGFHFNKSDWEFVCVYTEEVVNV